MQMQNCLVVIVIQLPAHLPSGNDMYVRHCLFCFNFNFIVIVVVLKSSVPGNKSASPAQLYRFLVVLMDSPICAHSVQLPWTWSSSGQYTWMGSP